MVRYQNPADRTEGRFYQSKPITRGRSGKERKRFFFEKKKQKTFAKRGF
jgi:hypothetical protein